MTKVVKPIGETLKKAWEWLNGKKTNIAALALLVVKILMMAGVNVPVNIMEIIDLFLYTFLGIGLGHKAMKNGKLIK